MSRSAERDVDSAWHWLADRNRLAADRLLDRLQEIYRILLDYPEAGRLRNDLGPSIRSILTDPHVVFYSADIGGIRVHRVLHGARDVRPEDVMFDR